MSHNNKPIIVVIVLFIQLQNYSPHVNNLNYLGVEVLDVVAILMLDLKVQEVLMMELQTLHQLMIEQ